MADVQHKNLTGSDLHEPKGVAALTLEKSMLLMELDRGHGLQKL